MWLTVPDNLDALVAAASFITMFMALQNPPQMLGWLHMWTTCASPNGAFMRAVAANRTCVGKLAHR